MVLNGAFCYIQQQASETDSALEDSSSGSDESSDEVIGHHLLN